MDPISGLENRPDGNPDSNVDKAKTVMPAEENLTKETNEGATATQPAPGDSVRLGIKAPLRLDCGMEISDFPVAFQTYGELNQDKSNAILICHALTGDQFVSGKHPITGKEGWWELMVGPGKTIDTDTYFVICANILGGCMGTLGPKEINPETGFRAQSVRGRCGCSRRTLA